MNDERTATILAAPTMMDLVDIVPRPTQDECAVWFEAKGYQRLWIEDGVLYMRKMICAQETISLTATGIVTLTRMSDVEWEQVSRYWRQQRKTAWPYEVEDTQ